MSMAVGSGEVTEHGGEQTDLPGIRCADDGSGGQLNLKSRSTVGR
jgi:hypothetical protein